jgi:hypothetical protein
VAAPPASAPRNPNFKNGGYSEVLDKLGIPHRTIQPQMSVDLSGWPKDQVAKGLRVARVTGPKAGLARNAMPGAKFVTLDEVRKLDVARQATGLYLVGIDFVPRDLAEILKAHGLKLDAGGKLVDRLGEPVAAFVTSEMYRAEILKQALRESGSPSGLLTGLLDGLVPSAEAASPFPWRCFSFTPWALYHGGFHRWYEADTWVAAYGADGGGGCSSGSPLTRIDFLQARAEVGGGGSTNHCFNCETKHAHDEWDVGWFWPAHGIPVTTHSGVWADGSFSFSRTAHLSW